MTLVLLRVKCQEDEGTRLFRGKQIVHLIGTLELIVMAGMMTGIIPSTKDALQMIPAPNRDRRELAIICCGTMEGCRTKRLSNLGTKVSIALIILQNKNLFYLPLRIALQCFQQILYNRDGYYMAIPDDKFPTEGCVVNPPEGRRGYYMWHHGELPQRMYSN
uniref:Uncharacterized protein n=1 Tax=Glossina pallidipes TaxID=7398 RepID=A0A1A9Z2G9_GLOPL